MTTSLAEFKLPPGLNGVQVSDTTIGDVRGGEGFYHYRQYSATELASKRSFEDVWRLLLDGSLPATSREQQAFAEEVRAIRPLPPGLVDALAAIVRATPRDADPLDGVRTACSMLGSALGMRPIWDLDAPALRSDVLRLTAAMPTLVATLHRLANNQELIDPDPELGHSANYLWMLTGSRPDPLAARTLEQYMILVLDHGFNASTFTARVVASTGADVAAAVVAAIGALSGPLHGSAPGRALEMIKEVGRPERADAFIRETLQRGGRLMGFGHAVYRGEDPRSAMLREMAVNIGGDIVDLALAVEKTALAALADMRQSRPLGTNVEYYAGVVMERCGLPGELFTPTFALSRTVGWCANIAEQAEERKLIRPAARYVGPPPPEPVPPAS